MKKVILSTLLASFALVMAACGGSDDAPAPAPPTDNKITLSTEKIEASAAGGTFKVDVAQTGNAWRAYTNDEWIAVSVTGSTQKTGTVTVTVAKNASTESRSGIVYVSTGSQRTTITVVQEATITASASEFNVLSAASTDAFTVNTTDFDVTTDAAWITANKDGQTVNLSFAENTNLRARTGNVVVKAGQQTITITVKQESAADNNVPSSREGGYKLVWNDEFNGSTLGSDWTHEVQSSGWVNNELQNYVNNNKVTNLADGKLNITCYKATDGKIYSGRVYAKVNTGWKYGYMEARIMLPKGKGTWPAFWMMPANNNYQTDPWPGCGEIDIMEEVGVTPNEVSSTIHCNRYNNGNTATEHGATKLSDAEGEYHVYSCEWEADHMTFFVDGKQILRYNNDGTGHDAWPFDKPFYIILNLAWGGSWGGMNGVDETALPVTMKVDYVRVYQK